MQYTEGWNRDIPTLVTNHSRARFIGPVTAYFDEPYIQYFLAHANPHPYAISWHAYPCQTGTSDPTCMSYTNGEGPNITAANTDMANAGVVVPIWITEWNLDLNGNDSRYTNQSYIQSRIGSELAAFQSEEQTPNDNFAVAMFYNIAANNAYTDLVSSNDT